MSQKKKKEKKETTIETTIPIYRGRGSTNTLNGSLKRYV